MLGVASSVLRGLAAASRACCDLSARACCVRAHERTQHEREAAGGRWKGDANEVFVVAHHSR